MNQKRLTKVPRKGPTRIREELRSDLKRYVDDRAKSLRLLTAGEPDSSAIAGLEPFLDSRVLPSEFDPVRILDENVTSTAIAKTNEPEVTIPTVGLWDSTTNITGAVTADGNGYGVVFYTPSIYASYAVHSNTAFVPTDRTWSAVLNSHQNILGPGGTTWMSHGLRNGSHVFMPFLDSNGVMVGEMGSIAPGTVDLTLITDRAYSGGAMSRLRYQAVAGGPWINDDQAVDFRGGIAAATHTLAGAIFGLALGVFPTGASPLPNDITWSMLTASIGTLPANSYTHFELRNADSLTGLNENRTSSFRPTAGSLLITYQGSDLKNGGNVAVLRSRAGAVPKPVAGDFYKYIMSVPDNHYQGQLKDGAYVWWHSTTQADYDFRAISDFGLGDLRNRTILIATVKQDQRDQSVRLLFTNCIEFQTENPLYSAQISDGNYLLSMAAAILSALPAASENPVHLNFFKKLLSSTKNFLAKNPNLRKVLRLGVSALMPRVANVVDKLTT